MSPTCPPAPRCVPEFTDSSIRGVLSIRPAPGRHPRPDTARRARGSNFAREDRFAARWARQRSWSIARRGRVRFQAEQARWLVRDMVPIARKLARDAHDAESLMTVGYFLYSNHIDPVCDRENATFWSRELGVCTNEDPGWSRGPAPIGMFERARVAFEDRPTRAEAEGRLLRMMIHCYRTRSNRASCLRGSGIGARRRPAPGGSGDCTSTSRRSPGRRPSGGEPEPGVAAGPVE